MRYLPLGVTAVHSALVLLMAALVGGMGGEAVMLWNLFMLIDFPASVIGAPLFGPVEEWLMTEFGHRWTFTVGYAAHFGLLGGLQYYGLAALAVVLRKRFGATEVRS